MEIAQPQVQAVDERERFERIKCVDTRTVSMRASTRFHILRLHSGRFYPLFYPVAFNIFECAPLMLMLYNWICHVRLVFRFPSWSASAMYRIKYLFFGRLPLSFSVSLIPCDPHILATCRFSTYSEAQQPVQRPTLSHRASHCRAHTSHSPLTVLERVYSTLFACNNSIEPMTLYALIARWLHAYPYTHSWHISQITSFFFARFYFIPFFIFSSTLALPLPSLHCVQQNELCYGSIVFLLYSCPARNLGVWKLI